METLLTRLSNWAPFRAVVVGDVMLDQFVYGDAERLTADAPVPVLHTRRTESTPGGAANVCLDLVALHGHVSALGVTGDDPEGAVLRQALALAGVDTSGLIADPSRPTTVKRNLVGLAQHRHPQKMFRVDVESREPVSADLRARILAALDRLLPQTDVVLLEDYAKGVCSPELCRAVIDRCVAAGVEVLVDPASLNDYSRYRGCTAITPNRTEAERATGLAEDRTNDPQQAAAHHRRLAEALAQTVRCRAVVLTLDRHGALLLEEDAQPVPVPTVARQVYDVTGAGDMVLAALGAARANRLGWEDAVRFANAAAGLEVEVFGVQPIPFERVHQHLLRSARALIGKRRSLEEAVVEAAAARRDGQRVVFTNGCFDILHAGHVALLRKARSLGGMLIVGINSDASVRRLKGHDRPVHNEDDRAAILSELESVDAVVVFDEDTPMRLLETLRPEVLAKGGDYNRSGVVGADFVESYGGTIELIELLQGRSTTSAIERIRAT